MNEKFFELPEEKQDAMLNAAMTVFSRSGYKKAATDEIVQLAGISKGLLFHYFGSKKGLYLYLYSYSRDCLLSEIRQEYDRSETDFFAMLVNVQQCKMNVMRRHPYLLEFLSKAYVEKDEEVVQPIQADFHADEDISRAVILSRADASKFKPGVSLERVLDMVIWMSEGALHFQSQGQITDLAALNEKYLACLEILKQNLYGADALRSTAE